jgi:hypothetical protein
MDRFPNISTLYLLISRAHVLSLSFSFLCLFFPASSPFLDVYYDVTVVYVSSMSFLLPRPQAARSVTGKSVYPKAAVPCQMCNVNLATSPQISGYPHLKMLQETSHIFSHVLGPLHIVAQNHHNKCLITTSTGHMSGSLFLALSFGSVRPEVFTFISNPG